MPNGSLFQASYFPPRYTPFGEGLVSLSLVPVRRYETNKLVLWNANSLNHPMYTFMGNEDRITEFCWRNRLKKLSETLTST